MLITYAVGLPLYLFWVGFVAYICSKYELGLATRLTLISFPVVMTGVGIWSALV